MAAEMADERERGTKSGRIERVSSEGNVGRKRDVCPRGPPIRTRGDRQAGLGAYLRIYKEIRESVWRS